MARPKRRANITLDMTPMVDIGFLLVIFFMSTYHARPQETVRVNLPLSRSPLKVPEQQVMIISVLPREDARVLTDSFNPTALRKHVLHYLAYDSVEVQGRLNLAVDRAVREMRGGRLHDSVVNEAKLLYPGKYDPRKDPRRDPRADSLLLWWNLDRDAAQPFLFEEIGPTIRQVRVGNPNTVLVIKTDSLSRSGDVLRLMERLQDPSVNMLRFSLMTMMRESRSAPKAAAAATEE